MSGDREREKLMRLIDEIRLVHGEDSPQYAIVSEVLSDLVPQRST